MKKYLVLAFVAFLAVNCATKKSSVYRTEIKRPGVVLSTNDVDIATEVANHNNNYATLPPSIDEALKVNPHAYVKVDANGVTYYGESASGGYMQGIWENYTNSPLEVTIFQQNEQIAQFMVPPKKYTRLALLPGSYQSVVKAGREVVRSEFLLSPIKGRAYSSLAKEWCDFTQYNRTKD
ncbi:hypothetical protein JW977_03505 [Candidatus Falkowbacteria bacterium]|nr:hypothetical protein [Candidatus Falkowbacteria bacterium]